MPSAVKLRTDFTAGELRRLAKKAKDVLWSIALKIRLFLVRIQDAAAATAPF